jgi:hypothetical protein
MGVLAEKRCQRCGLGAKFERSCSFNLSGQVPCVRKPTILLQRARKSRTVKFFPQVYCFSTDCKVQNRHFYGWLVFTAMPFVTWVGQTPDSNVVPVMLSFRHAPE